MINNKNLAITETSGIQFTHNDILYSHGRAITGIFNKSNVCYSFYIFPDNGLKYATIFVFKRGKNKELISIREYKILRNRNFNLAAQVLDYVLKYEKKYKMDFTGKPTLFRVYGDATYTLERVDRFCV